MIILQGKGVSGGVERAVLSFPKRAEEYIRKESVIGRDGERARFEKALADTAEQLGQLAEKCRGELGEDEAALFEIHAMLAMDEDFTSSVCGIIDDGDYSAEYAVHLAGERFAAVFAAMDDGYMNERAADIIDVTKRIIRNLSGETDSGIDYGDGRVIAAADDFTPSETVQFDKSKIAGFVTRGGSSSSHTAILARTMGIPAVCGIGDALLDVYHGKSAYIDGGSGQIVIEPDEETARALESKYAVRRKNMEFFRSMIGKEDVTPDGQRMDIFCNIGSPEDVQSVLDNDGSGIGLFRSEFLYLASDDYPNEEEQFEAYRKVVTAMNGRRVVIRTLDIGADKQADYFGLNEEENPALGMRAVRICLSCPDVFRTQLRALYRASAFGRVAIMFPMITSVWEVEECLGICREVMRELSEEGIPFSTETEIGIMIETPAAVLIADELAELVDFFSVGTNDLTQYTLACDRQTGGLDRFFDPRHPAVLRAIGMAADAAHRNGIWIGICGELGSDTSLLPTFLGMGIDEISVPPSEVLPLRAELRNEQAGKFIF